MIELKEHNQKPYSELCEKMEQVQKCAYISATGTGKSYVIGKYIEEHGLLKKTLLLVPSRNIKAGWEKLLPGIKVRTYHYLCMGRKTHDIPLEGYDLIVCDELHHLGADEWGRVYQELTKDFSGKIIGATATPVRFLDKGRNMVTECFDGNMVEGLSLPDAISCGVLPSMDYTTALYNLPKHLPENRSGIQNEYTANLYRQLDFQSSHYSFKRILSDKLSDGMNHKVAVFVDGIDRIDEIKSLCEEIFPAASHYVGHSKLSDVENEKAFENFTADKRMSFLYTINMLNEGAHIKGVDTLVMFRKTESPLIYLQQLGRALTSDAGSDRIKIFDFVANHTNLKTVTGGSGSVIQWVQEHIGNPERQIVVNDYALEELELLEKLRDVLNGLWTEEEDKILEENYSGHRRLNKLCELLPNRSVSAIKYRARTLGLVSYKKWMPEEDEILCNLYGSPNGMAELLDALPERSESAIKSRAGKLRIVKKASPSWTQEENKVLLTNPCMDLEMLVKLFPERSRTSILNQRHKLGITEIKHHPSWKDDEDKLIIDNPGMTAKELKVLLPGRTDVAIGVRKRKLLGVTKPNGKKWSKGEDAIIRANINLNDEELAQLLPGRSARSIISHRSKAGMLKRNPLSSEDESLFRTLYEGGGFEAVMSNKSFSQMSKEQILHHASNHKYRKNSSRKWTDEEIKILLALLSDEADKKIDWDEVQKKIPRHSIGSTQHKYKSLKDRKTGGTEHD